MPIASSSFSGFNRGDPSRVNANDAFMHCVGFLQGAIGQDLRPMAGELEKLLKPRFGVVVIAQRGAVFIHRDPD